MFTKLKPTAFIIAALLSHSVSAETPVYGVLLNVPDSSYWSALENGLREGATAEQAEYYLQAVENDQTADAPLLACLSMLDRKPNVLLIAANHAAVLTPCIERAGNLNIPVIGLGDSTQPFDRDDIGLASVVQTDHQKTAALGADFVATSLGSNASGSVLFADTSESNMQAKAFISQLKKQAPELEVLVVKPDEISNAAKDTMAIVASDSASTLATLDTLTDTDNNLLIVSLDDEAASPALLEAGKIHAAIAQLPYLVGKTAMTEASKAMNAGLDSNADTVIQPVLLTKQTLTDGSEPMLEFIK